MDTERGPTSTITSGTITPSGSAAPRERSALLSAAERLQKDARLDPLVERLGSVAAPFGRGSVRRALGGDWLGHALHPLLTDLPLGCWFSASLLDVVPLGGTAAASRRLCGFGVLFAIPTAASGLSDWTTLRSPSLRRVGAAHAAGNSGALVAYFLSWRARRRGHHVRGALLGFVGGFLAIGAGYLGGHLSFGRGANTGSTEPTAVPVQAA
jgi:uncharacterized membrane protein